MKRSAIAIAAALLSMLAFAGCGSADDQASGSDDSSTASTENGDSTDDADDSGAGDAKNNGKNKKSKKSKKDNDEQSDSDPAESDDTDESDDSNDSRDREKQRSERDNDDSKSDDDSDSDDGDDSNTASRAYCGEVRKLKQDFDPSNLASMETPDLDGITSRLRDISDAAPANIQSNWNELAGAFQKLTRTLNKYDVDLSDSEAFSKLKPKAQKAIQRAAAGMQDLSSATRAIERDVQNTCGISMQ